MELVEKISTFKTICQAWNQVKKYQKEDNLPKRHVYHIQIQRQQYHVQIQRGERISYSFANWPVGVKTH